MTDTQPVTRAIASLILMGVTGPQIVAHVVMRFPELTRTEFVAAAQDATAAAEKQIIRRH
jgi:hypothetical protein